MHHTDVRPNPRGEPPQVREFFRRAMHGATILRLFNHIYIAIHYDCRMALEKVTNNLVNWEVIHISTGHEGGAGIAARRLNSALNSSGIQSKFAALKHENYIPLDNEFEIRRNFVRKILGKFATLLQNLISDKTLFTIFSGSSLPIKTITSFAQPGKTILHFHNWFNLITQKQIVKLGKMGYSIVVTLHDERFFTGGCHYSLSCNHFQNTCSPCPELILPLSIMTRHNLKIKNKINEIPKFVAVAPSIWIKSEAASSAILREREIVFIPNTLGQFNSSKVTNWGGKDAQVLLVGVASKIASSYIKGGDLIQELQSLIEGRDAPFELVFLNSSICQENPELNFWRKIDLLLVPSRADNSPNVIHEAKTFGIPVIGSSAGGIPELLFEGFDEIIPVEHLSAQKIFDQLNAWVRYKSLDRPLMRQAFEDYVGQSVFKHIDIYRKITNN